MKYTIECLDDNSFRIVCDTISKENNVSIKTKNLLSFCMQYIYTCLNEHEILLSESAKKEVVETVKSFDFDSDDINQLSKILLRMGYNINKVMMTYNNGVPKDWDSL